MTIFIGGMVAIPVWVVYSCCTHNEPPNFDGKYPSHNHPADLSPKISDITASFSIPV